MAKRTKTAAESKRYGRAPPPRLSHIKRRQTCLPPACGLIGARYAAPACTTLPDCQGAWWPSMHGWTALHPFITLAGPAVPGEAGGVALHLLHRYAAALAAVLLAVVALRLHAVPRARNAVLAALTLLVLEALLGMLTVASGYSLWLAVAHNVGAALLLAAAASLMHSIRK